MLAYKNVSEIPDSLFDIVNTKLKKISSESPTVSVVIPAWNEELNVFRTIESLSRNESQFSFEIVVVNNNSTDSTQNTLDRLYIRSFMQPQQGCGPARQLGQEMARGKYILTADADCFYPIHWVENMTRALEKKNVICVYGKYSFLGSKERARWKFFFYERLRDLAVELRHINRPYLNALGMTMGYHKEYGLKVGFVDHQVRGEDGRLCFDLMRYGKIDIVRGNSNRVWTTPRTLDKEGNLLMSLFTRIVLELARLGQYFYKRAPHSTNTSQPYQSFLMRFFKKYKSLHKENEN